MANPKSKQIYRSNEKKAAVLSFINQKGGVGKSTLAFNFAMYLVEKGYKTLVVDADEQGSISATLDQYKSNIKASDLFDANLNLSEEFDSNLVLFRGTSHMKNIESFDDEELVLNLTKNIEKINEKFDYIVVDTPGSNSKAANAYLLVSNYTCIPTVIDNYSVDVSLKVLDRIATVKKHYNHKLVNLGLLINLFERTSPSQKNGLSILMKEHKQSIIESVIPRCTAYRDAEEQQLPVWALKKTAAKKAGKEVKTAFDLMMAKMEMN